jgi:putative transposase
MRRHFLPGCPVHLIQRGNNRGQVFFDADDARRYHDGLMEIAAQEGVAVHAYVLMTNHVHLLASPTTPDGLGRCMQALGIRTTRSVNARRSRVGTLWSGPYRAAPIIDERYFIACSRYIEMNPVRAGLAPEPAAFRWSSYRANADGRNDPLVTPHAIYLSLGATPDARRAAYRALFDQALDDDTLAAIRAATNSNAELHADYTPRSRGRPREGSEED